MPPAGDPGRLAFRRAVRPETVGDQQHAGHAVGDLSAVGAPQPPLDDGIVVVVVGEAARAERPAPGLRERVGLGVAHVEFGDGVQVRVVQAVPPVVLVGQLAEHVRPHELRVLALVPDPGGRAQVLRRVGAGHVALLLHREHQHAVVPARLDLGGGAQDRDAARGAGRLVPGGRLAPQPGLDGGGHRAQLPLPGEQLPEGVPDVDRLDVLGSRPALCRVPCTRFGHHVGDLQALACVVPREVALVAAGDPRARGAHAVLPACRGLLSGPAVGGLPFRTDYNRWSDPSRDESPRADRGRTDSLSPGTPPGRRVSGPDPGRLRR